MKIASCITAALLLFAVAAQADTEISPEIAKNIKTYSLHKYVVELPNLKEGDIIKVEFTFRGMHWKENEGDFINTHVYGTDHSDSARVQVPNNARAWFMKVPEHGSPRNAHNYFVFAKVIDEDNNNKRLEFLGNVLDGGFDKPAIRWAGQN